MAEKITLPVDSASFFNLIFFPLLLCLETSGPQVPCPLHLFKQSVIIVQTLPLHPSAHVHEYVASSRSRPRRRHSPCPAHKIKSVSVLLATHAASGICDIGATEAPSVSGDIGTVGVVGVAGSIGAGGTVGRESSAGGLPTTAGGATGGTGEAAGRAGIATGGADGATGGSDGTTGGAMAGLCGADG